MIKNCLFAVALLSLALAGGCAKGGNGAVPTIIVSSNSISTLYPTESLTITATTTDPVDAPVTWSLTGPGTLTPVTPATNPATAVYLAPSSPSSQVTISAAFTSNASVSDSLDLSVVDITTAVTPSNPTLNVGTGLTQQFTAVAEPDRAPQNFTWTCTANGVPCANFHQDSNVSSLAYYKAEDSCGNNCVTISAASTLDPTGCSANPKNCTTAQASLVASRVNGTYAFQFSGYDGNNKAIAVIGSFTATNGSIASGAEEVLTASGPSTQNPIPIIGGSYTPTSSDPNNSNNAGVLTLTLPSGVYPKQFQVVLDGAGDIGMIESDGHGTGSGSAHKSSPGLFNGATDQTYAFGFTGVDSSGKRIGYVGILPLNGSGMIVNGQVDGNDGGTTNTYSSVTGAYAADSNISGLWHVTNLALNSSLTLDFDFFVASAANSKTNPLTLFAVSTDAVDATHPAVSGTMVLQDSTLAPFSNASLTGNSVSALTGVNGANTNVSLTLGTTDGKGNFSGSFDQNNAGTILSSVAFPIGMGTSNYTYAASGTAGRYTINMLGNPGAKTVVPPLPFVLYASGANRGFLLDQSASVIAGTMYAQGKNALLGGSELPGTYAVATTNSGTSGVDPIAANLLFTFSNAGSCTSSCVNGTLYDTANPAGVTLAGANPGYSLMEYGNGTVALTAPSTQNYVIYVIDTSGTCSLENPACLVQGFLMMDVDSANPNASIISAQQ
jgi:hypothetical protein